jgi:hypothetical protein
MESITSGGRSVTVALTWLMAVIVLIVAAWALTRLGGHAAVTGVADPTSSSGGPSGGGLPWG